MSDADGRYRLGFDIGGTFTDFVLADTHADAGTGAIHLHKCLTTPGDPSIGAIRGMLELLERVGVPLAAVDHLVHGTTLVTNAIIERRGGRLGLLTTRGFRDVLQLGTEQRYDIHDLFLRFPEPLVPRRLRRELEERVDRDGTVVVALERAQACAEIDALVAAGVDAIAVCLLHAYKNPVHERAVRELIEGRHPEVSVSISSEVHPELREFERTSTTAANAYARPLMRRYVEKVRAGLREHGFGGRFHLMQSSGDLSAPEVATALPVRFLESGPAGGAQASAHLGARLGHDDIISFDMGGTTAKACLIQAGRPDVASHLEAARVHRFKRGSGLPVHAPVVDMIEIGAGGGSIARVDELGLLKVGPDSAGAEPGPACYGQGGEAPTVTDANLVAGYLDPGFFLGGRMRLDPKAAARAMTRVAEPLGLDPLQAAAGIIDLVDENMAGAARVHIVEKGRDPRRYAMVAMGGAGPLHAARVARKLGVSEVIVPPASGAASALGFLAAPIGHQVSRSLPMRLDALELERLRTLLEALEAECRARLSEAGGDGTQAVFERLADMRLVGQMHEITVTLPDAAFSATGLDELRERFAREYARLYTHLYEGAEIEVINWRVRVAGARPEPPTRLAQDSPHAAPIKGTRAIYSPDDGGMVEATIHDRYALRVGMRIDGPAVVEERESTTIVPRGDALTVDDGLNLRLAIRTEVDGALVVGAVGRPGGLEAAVARIESDPVGLEIMWRRLINVTEECWHTVIRTAFSLIIGEAQDFACELLDPRGRQIVHSPRAMPVFNLTLPMAVNAMIERHPRQTLVEGDILVTNDPWCCAGHLFDIAIAVPVFRDGRIVAFVGIVGHVTDVGGTKDDLNAREIYDEGFQIPPMKLFKAGEPNQDLFDLLRRNVRQADQVIGDVHALVSAGRTGAERLSAFMTEYGMHDLEALASVVQSRAERAMRGAITALPDGVYEHTLDADGVEGVMTYPARVEIRGDAIQVDFDGAPPQTERGGSNCTLSYTRAHATYPLKCLLTPEVPGNAGCYRPMQVDAPAGSIFNCDYPKAVNTRVRTGWYIAPNLFGALAEAAPDRVQAFTGLPSSALFYGVDAGGSTYSDHLFQGGGQGASSHGDGVSGLLYPTSAANTSVELFETRVPVLVTEKALVPDSGGPGRHRGGLAQRVTTRKLHADGRPCQVGLYPIGVRAPVAGLFGGRPGRRAAATIDTIGGGRVDLDTGGLSELDTEDQRATLVMAGGSGYGDPWTRSIDAVQHDLDDGLITAAGARRDYGCVLGADGRIDRAATEALRARGEPADAAAE